MLIRNLKPSSVRAKEKQRHGKPMPFTYKGYFMSGGVNKVILVGHLGQDPEVRYMPNGGAVANISIATSESWRDKNSGEQREKTEWHRVSIFGKLAEVAGEYLRKGSQVYIEGKMQTRKWQDQSGQDRYTTEVAVQPIGGRMQMLGGKPSQGQAQPRQQQGHQQGQNQAQQRPQQQSGWGQQQSQAAPQQYDNVPDFDDDIHF